MLEPDKIELDCGEDSQDYLYDDVSEYTYILDGKLVSTLKSLFLPPRPPMKFPHSI